VLSKIGGGTWETQEVDGTQEAVTETVKKTDCYYVDICALDEDDVPQPGLIGKFSSSIATLVEINGEVVSLQANQDIGVLFNSSGRLGVCVKTFNSIIPDTFT
jgi:hypothetical protein